MVSLIRSLQQFLLQDILAHTFARKSKDRLNFWSEVRRLNNSSGSSCVPVIDGISGSRNMLASKFEGVLN